MTQKQRDLFQLFVLIAAMLATVVIANLANGQTVRYNGYRYRTDGTYLSVNGGCTCRMCQMARAYNSQVNSMSIARSQPRQAHVPPEPSAEAGVQHTPWEDMTELVQLMRLQEYDTVVDIGCGDGRVLIMAANAHGSRGVGIEYDGRLVELARENIARTNFADKIVVHHANAENWYGYKDMVVYCYLWTDLLQKISPHLVSAKRVVSYQHPVPGLPMYEVILQSGGKAYVYERQIR